MWKGQAFEFFFNTVFWSFIIMYALFVAGRMFGLIYRPARTPGHLPFAPDAGKEKSPVPGE
jgi:hypothetical protein